MYAFSPDPTDPLAMLAACPAYRPTPVHQLDAVAERCGWRSLLVKDESVRMGLGSFKALGGVYAVAQAVRSRAETLLGRVPTPEEMALEAVRRIAAEMTFTCASAGNHGLAVAAGAQVFGARAVIHLAASVDEGFAMRLRERGADVVRSGAVYEDAMAAACAGAREHGRELLADTSWPGYDDIPATIMRGYTVMADEMRVSLAATNAWPSHLALQAGVGGMASAVASHVRAHWPVQPDIVIVEPEAAPCLRDSLAAGRPLRADGPVSTQGRLDCKEASHLAVEVLREADVQCICVTDRQAEEAVEMLGVAGIATTPSGAAGLAGLIATGLPADATPLALITEGQA